VNVDEQKQQARALEQQGETEAALELYEKVLAELEGTPDIWRELPLYVKAGDLSLKLNDSSNAISHYEKAANAYAAYGSSKSVIALCIKILRVNPGRTHVFLRLVRLMIEREHLADARLVLLEYCERLKLPKAALVLEGLGDSSEEQMKPALEMLLELGGRYEYARAQGRDDITESKEAVEEVETVAMEGTASSDSDPEATMSLTAAEQMDEVGETHEEPEPAAEELDQTEPEIQSIGDRESETTGEKELETPAAGETDDEIQWVEDRPSVPMATPRASRQVLFREAEKRRNHPKAVWIGLGSAAVVVVIGLSLVLFDVIPLGGGGGNQEGSQPAPSTSPADSELTDGPDLEDSTVAEHVVDNSPNLDDAEPTAISPRTVAAVEDSSQPAAADSIVQVETAVDSQPADEAVVRGDTIAELAQPEIPPSQGVMVQDFDIDSNTEFEVDGRAGYRVTQTLGTGELLTLSAVYYGEEISTAPGSGEMTLLPLAGDTTAAIISFSGYSVEARALVSASVLQTLLGRLVEVPRPN